jgi:hypothetical protein
MTVTNSPQLGSNISELEMLLRQHLSRNDEVSNFYLVSLMNFASHLELAMRSKDINARSLALARMLSTVMALSLSTGTNVQAVAGLSRLLLLETNVAN